jgi:flagellar hook-associated protein 3 FlgL
MTSRVSTQGMVDQVLSQLQAETSALSTLNQQISSGVLISKPSVNPAVFVQAQTFQDQSDQLQIYQTNIGTTTTTLNSSVSALQNVGNLLSTAQQQASLAVNGSTDPAAYPAIADEVNGLIQQLMTLVNAQSNGQYSFGGTKTSQPPFVVTSTNAAGDPEVVTYQGSTTAAQAIVGQGQTVNTFYAGDQVFQQPGADVFQALIGLRDALTNPNLTPLQVSQAATAQMAEIQQAQTTVQNTVGQQSSSLQALQAMGNQFSTLQLNDKTQNSNLTSTDISTAIVSLQEQQNLLQATLEITSRLFSPSFLTFMNGA